MALRARAAAPGRSIYDLEGGSGGDLASIGMRPSKKSVDFVGLPNSMTITATALISLTAFLSCAGDVSSCPWPGSSTRLGGMAAVA